VLNAIKSDPYVAELGVKIKFLNTELFGGLCEPSRNMRQLLHRAAAEDQRPQRHAPGLEEVHGVAQQGSAICVLDCSTQLQVTKTCSTLCTLCVSDQEEAVFAVFRNWSGRTRGSSLFVQ